MCLSLACVVVAKHSYLEVSAKVADKEDCDQEDTHERNYHSTNEL